MAVFTRLGNILLSYILLEVVSEALLKIVTDLDEVANTQNSLEAVTQ